MAIGRMASGSAVQEASIFSAGGAGFPNDRSAALGPGVGFGQPKVISVFMRSAGHTKLSGTLVNASIGGLLPSGSPTM